MKRIVSTPHLVLGIIFAGIAALWFLGQATDAKISDTAPGFPLVLIGAGAVGLVASLTNARHRNRSQPEVSTDPEDAAVEDDAEPTTVITTEENQ